MTMNKEFVLRFVLFGVLEYCIYGGFFPSENHLQELRLVMASLRGGVRMIGSYDEMRSLLRWFVPA